MIDIHKMFSTKEWRNLGTIEADIDEDGDGTLAFIGPARSIVVVIDVKGQDMLTYPIIGTARIGTGEYFSALESDDDMEWAPSNAQVHKRLDFMACEWNDVEEGVNPLTFDPVLFKKVLSAIDKEPIVAFGAAKAGVFVRGDGWRVWIGHKKETINASE